jgi:hypothetical protein
MKIIGKALCVAALSTVGLVAQTSQTTTETKITVKDGETVNVTGCVAPDLNHTGYILTNVADKTGPLHNYMLLTDDTDFSKHVGHRVQVEGRVTDRGDAKVKVETKTETKVKDGDDRETKTKSEIKGDAITLPYMGVKSFKMVAASCP